MTFDEKRLTLRSKIESTLIPLINSDYVLLELPYYCNIGDLLIWEGEKDFLAKIPYKCLYKASLFSYNKNYKIPSNAIILLQGGGNFGDLWERSQEFRLYIINKFPHNKIIIFPQTVFYANESKMHQDALLMSAHSNLTICARDMVSFDLLKANFKNDILLLPDMAFCINVETLLKYRVNYKNEILFVKRGDKEFKKYSLNFTSNIPVTVSDWPTYEHRLFLDYVMKGLEKISTLLNRYDVKIRLLYSFIDWYAISIYKPYLLKKGVRFISEYKYIYTSRLHVAILSILLSKEFSFLDNFYGKNSQFYNTWLRDMDKIEMITQ